MFILFDRTNISTPSTHTLNAQPRYLGGGQPPCSHPIGSQVCPCPRAFVHAVSSAHMTQHCEPPIPSG